MKFTLKKVAVVVATSFVAAVGATNANAAAVASAFLNVTDFKLGLSGGATVTDIGFTNTIDSSAQLNGVNAPENTFGTNKTEVDNSNFQRSLSVIGSGSAAYTPGTPYLVNPATAYFAGSDVTRGGSALTPTGASSLTDATVVLNSEGDGSSQTNSGVAGHITVTSATAFDFSLSFLADYFIRADLDQPATAVLANITWTVIATDASDNVVFFWNPINLGRSVNKTVDEKVVGLVTDQLYTNGASLGAGTYQFVIRQVANADAILIPEPGSLALAGLGLLGLGALRRRKSA